jgi:membrane glycosyltransferase
MPTRTPTAWETAHASRSWRRALLGGLVLGTTSLGTYVAHDVLSVDRLSVVDVITLVLFALNLAWISSSFWTAMAGLTLRALRRDPITLEPQATDESALAEVVLTTRTALVMPIHQEDVARVFAGLEATYRSLEATGQLAAFDVFVLSDTRRPELASAEVAAWQRLVARVGGAGRIHYRRRVHNTNRKAGNLQDFCESWGARYENMVVLDADVGDGRRPHRTARAYDAAPPARGHDADAAHCGGSRDVLRALRAVRHAPQWARAVHGSGVLAAGRGQLLGSQRHHPRGAIYGLLRPALAAGARAVRRRHLEP